MTIKNKIKTMMISLLLGASFVLGISFTVTWFDSQAKVEFEDNLMGQTEGAYFAYGKGTQAKPYGINKARHLYNLAWLNYQGYFDNKDNTGDGVKGDIFYFEIDPTIDVLDGLDEGVATVIPPIGTKKNPFYGRFNGNNKIITNFVISNDFDDFNKTPLNVTKDNFVQPEIVGFIGVIGQTPDATYKYNFQANEFINTGLSNITINVNTSQALTGIAAGYVNAKVQNVSVDSSTIDIKKNNVTSLSYTENISDYSIIGYCADPKYKSTIKKVDEEVYGVNIDPNTYAFDAADGDSQGWGGSLNMRDMYIRLRYVRIAGSSASYTVRESRYTSGGTTKSIGTSSLTQYRYTSRPSAGNFVYSDSSSVRFMYMEGGKNITEYTEGYKDGYIVIGDGTNFLRNNSGSIANTTNVFQAAYWHAPEVGSSGKIYTILDGTTYYLRNNNGTLSLYSGNTSSYQTVWDIYQDDNVFSITSNYYTLYLNGTTWTLRNTSNMSTTLGGYLYFVYNNYTYYFGVDSNDDITFIDDPDDSQNKVWYYDSNGFYFTRNNTKYYLCYYTSGQSGGLGAKSTTSNVYRFTYSSGYIRMRYSYTYYYLTISNGSLGLNDSTTNAISVRALLNTNIKYPIKENKSYMEYTATDTTYFPLNVNEDGGAFSPDANAQDTTNITAANGRAKLNAGNYDPTDSNTGYVVSGSGETGYSLIRVSQYNMSDISNSYVSSDGEIKPTKVHTINSQNQDVMMSSEPDDKKEKFDDSRDSLYTNALEGNSYIYGLHFMSAQISMNDIVTANNISILGSEPRQYQLPVNSIDFNLKDKGYVNFISGTYFSADVTSFFSLHTVFRDANGAITDIKEISKIYGNTAKPNYSYVYEYDDGSFSKPYRIGGGNKKYEMSPDDKGTEPYVDVLISKEDFEDDYEETYSYSEIYDTVRITNYIDGVRQKDLTQNALYYFEIPMNSGEYCLGSVDGGTGGYLLYLDIGANATKLNRTVMYEHYKTSVFTFEYPTGVAFLASPLGMSDTNTVCVAILEGYKGKIIFDRESDTSMKVDNALDTTKAKLSYYDETITSITNSVSYDLTQDVLPKETHTEERRVMTFFDYNVNQDSYTRTIITDVSLDGAAYERESVIQVDQDGNLVENFKVYDNQGNKIENDSGGQYESTIVLVPEGHSPSEYFSNTKILRIRIILDNGQEYTRTLTLHLVIDDTKEGGVYYTYDKYDIYFTVSGDTITLIVKEKGEVVFEIDDVPISEGDIIDINVTPPEDNGD